MEILGLRENGHTSQLHDYWFKHEGKILINKYLFRRDKHFFNYKANIRLSTRYIDLYTYTSWVDVI